MSDPAADSSHEIGRRLSELGRERALRRGAVLFNQSDAADAIFWVAAGRLRLERHLASGRVVTLSLIRAPACLAEAALFAPRYHCRAVAEVASSVVVAPKAPVLELLRRDPSFALGMVRALAAEVRSLRQRLELRNLRPASERLLTYLALRQDQGEEAEDRPLASIAAELGLTPEALYRVVAQLEKQGAVRRQGRRIALAETPGT